MMMTSSVKKLPPPVHTDSHNNNNNKSNQSNQSNQLTRTAGVGLARARCPPRVVDAQLDGDVALRGQPDDEGRDRAAQEWRRARGVRRLRRQIGDQLERRGVG